MSQTILTRLSSPALPASSLSSTQAQVDGLVTHFVEEAANPRTLAAITAGGLAYRFGRIGALALGEGHVAAMPLRMISYGAGLGSEVTAFEFTNRSFQTLSPVTRHLSPNLWSWSGPGGWREGLASSAITFGMLKGAGSLGREQNLIFQHAFQSTAMVAGHNTAGLFGIGPRPEGTLAEQFLHAEATNLQLGAGSSLLHSFAPGIAALERGLDLSLSPVGAHGLKPVTGRAPSIVVQNVLENFLPQPVMAGTRAPSEGDTFERPFIVMMSSTKGKGGGGDEGDGDRESLPARPPRKSSLTFVLEGITRITDRDKAKEALSQLAAGLTGGLQRQVLAALTKLEAGEPISPIIRSILENPRLQKAAFLTEPAKEEIKRLVQALEAGETVHSSAPPSPVVGGRPTVMGFKRMVLELGLTAPDMAKVLNRTFAPLLDLTRYASFNGIIYISEEDEAKLRDYAKIDYQSLGEVLFFGRKDLERNWTVPEAARHLRMEPQELEDIEQNQRLPNQKQLERFARLYRLHPGFLKEASEDMMRRHPSLSAPAAPSTESGVVEASDGDHRSATGEVPAPPNSLAPDDENLEKIYQQRLNIYEDATKTPVETWPFDPADGFTDVRNIARFFAERAKKLRGQIDRDERTGLISINGLSRMTPDLERRLLLPTRRQSDGPRKSDWVLMFDIDHFRVVNETITHPNANIVLRETAQIIKEAVRWRDIPVRYGGEEFFVWLSNSDRDGAERVVEDIRSSVEQKVYNIPGYKPFHVTISSGAAEMRLLPNPTEGGDPIHEGSLEDAIRRSDRALFISKKNGRNQWTMSEE